MENEVTEKWCVCLCTLYNVHLSKLWVKRKKDWKKRLSNLFSPIRLSLSNVFLIISNESHGILCKSANLLLPQTHTQYNLVYKCDKLCTSFIKSDPICANGRTIFWKCHFGCRFTNMYKLPSYLPPPVISTSCSLVFIFKFIYLVIVRIVGSVRLYKLSSSLTHWTL